MRRMTLLTFVAPLLLIACPAAAADRAREVRTCAAGFLAALLDGDAGRAGAFACSDDAGASRIVEVMAINLASGAKLDAAVRRRFGTSDDDAAGPSSVVRLVETYEIEFDGDTAELGRPAGETLPLRKTSGGWKVDVAELAARRKLADTAEALVLAKRRADAVNQLVTEIAAGRYATATAARLARDERHAAAATAAADQGAHASVE